MDEQIALPEISLIPLLAALQHASWSEGNLRESAHHILRTQLGSPFGAILAPVVAALEEPEPSLTVPLAAFRALSVLRERAPEACGWMTPYRTASIGYSCTEQEAEMLAHPQSGV